MNAINIIGSDWQLEQLVDRLDGCEWVALDTEFLRERTYFPELGLVQLKSGAERVCIDPLSIDSLTPISTLLENPDIFKILHSCGQDLEALETRFPVTLDNLYDTQIAAAFCGYGDQLGYAALVDAICGVKLAKDHTRTDWTRRPLSTEQIEYALDDVEYLPALREALDEKLERNGRMPWFTDECRRTVDRARGAADPEEAWRRLKGASGFTATSQLCARELAIWREHRAIRRNRPRGWILSDPALLEISRTLPGRKGELANIAGVGDATIRHAGEAILDIVQRCRDVAAPNPVWQSVELMSAAERGRVKQLMALLRSRTQEAGISQPLVANRQVVEAFVRGDTDSSLFRGWRAELVGNEMLAQDR